MQCENAGCTEVAAWQPLIICKDENGETLLEGNTDTVVCDHCKDVATVDAFMDAGQYAILCEVFEVQGKPAPTRESMCIELRPL